MTAPSTMVRGVGCGAPAPCSFNGCSISTNECLNSRARDATVVVVVAAIALARCCCCCISAGWMSCAERVDSGGDEDKAEADADVEEATKEEEEQEAGAASGSGSVAALASSDDAASATCSGSRSSAGGAGEDDEDASMAEERAEGIRRAQAKGGALVRDVEADSQGPATSLKLVEGWTGWARS